MLHLDDAALRATAEVTLLGLPHQDPFFTQRDIAVNRIFAALRTVRDAQREQDATIAEDASHRDWIGGSTDNAVGTARKIADAIRGQTDE